MDGTRMFIVQSVQRARAAQFDGPPIAPWTTGMSQSLPPVPDKPKKAVKPASLAKGPMSNRPNMECVITAAGRQKWVLAPTIVEEVRARITAGQTTKTIAQAMHLPISTVSRVASGMRRETVVTPVLAAVEKEKDDHEAAPSVVQLVPHQTLPHRDRPHRTKPDHTSPALPCHNQPTKAEGPAMLPMCGAQRGYQEPARLFILDWERRMNAYEFEGEPGQGKPKKSRKRISSMTRGQLGETLRSHGVTVALAINCAAPGHPPRAISERLVKPAKTRYLDKKVAGQRDFDLDVQWRETCSQ
ncbi:hypothetical protein [Caballeronia sp. KNU42]